MHPYNRLGILKRYRIKRVQKIGRKTAIFIRRYIGWCRSQKVVHDYCFFFLGSLIVVKRGDLTIVVS
jgi:hypothetical protein